MFGKFRISKEELRALLNIWARRTRIFFRRAVVRLSAAGEKRRPAGGGEIREL